MFKFLKQIQEKRKLDHVENIKKYHALVFEQIKLIQDIGDTCPNAPYSFAEVYAAKSIVDSRIKNKKDLNEMFSKLHARNISKQGLNISFLISKNGE